MLCKQIRLPVRPTPALLMRKQNVPAMDDRFLVLQITGMQLLNQVI